MSFNHWESDYYEQTGKKMQKKTLGEKCMTDFDIEIHVKKPVRQG